MKVNSAYWNNNTKEMVFTTPLPPKDFLKNVPKQAHILDFGCGYGRLVEYLTNQGYNNYLGIDISKGLIYRAKRTYPKQDFRVASLKDLLKENKKFDFIIILGVIENIVTEKDRKSFVKELFELLNNHGQVYLETFLLDEKTNHKNYVLAHQKNKTYGTLILKNGQLTLFHDTKEGIDKLFCDIGFIKKESSKTSFKTWNDKSVKGYEVLFKKEQK